MLSVDKKKKKIATPVIKVEIIFALNMVVAGSFEMAVNT
jgi:hypothetical protein